MALLPLSELYRLKLEADNPIFDAEGRELDYESEEYQLAKSGLAKPPKEQQWLARQISKGGAFSPAGLTKIGMQYLGRPIQTDADWMAAHAKLKQSIAGKPSGTRDATGYFAVPGGGTFMDRYAGQIIGGLALGGTLAGLGGAFAGAGGSAGSGTAGAIADATVSGAADDLFLSGLAGESVTGGTAGSTAAGAEFGLGGGATGYGVSGNAAIPGGGAATTAGGSLLPAAGGSLIPGVPNNVLLGLGQAGLGYLGADKQSDAFRDVAAQNLAIGAPYRSELEASYRPGFDLFKEPGYGDAFQRAADVSGRAYSAKFGNPFDSPTAQGGIMRDVWQGSYLPALANYRGQLGQFGGLGLNTAGQAQMSEAAGAGGGLNAIAFGLNTALNPQPSLDEILGKIANAQKNARLVV